MQSSGRAERDSAVSAVDVDGVVLLGSFNTFQAYVQHEVFHGKSAHTTI